VSTYYSETAPDFVKQNIEQGSLANARLGATVVCVWRLIFAISTLFDAPWL